MKCTSCGADIRPGSTVCEYCDSSVELAEVNGQRAWLFEQVKQSAAYARRNSPERLAAVPGIPALMIVVPIVIVIIFIGAGIFVTGLAWTGALAAGSSFGGVRLMTLLCFSLLPMGFVIVGIVGLGHYIKQVKQYREALVETRVAVITSKNRQSTPKSEDAGGWIGYYVTAEFEDGRRQEFRTTRSGLFGRIAEGDAGVLFSRSDVALDFDRVGGAS